MIAALAPYGVTPQIARRVFARVHRDHGSTLEEVRGLSHAQARRIAAEAVWPALEVVERRRSADGFVKYLFRLAPRPGEAVGPAIEAVRIPLPDPEAARALKERRRAG